MSKKFFYENKFTPRGIGISHKQPPRCVVLPPNLDAIVCAQENISGFIREAIAEKVKREGLDKTNSQN